MRKIKTLHQAIVEFAIVFPIFMLMGFGILQLCLIYIDHIVVKYAAFQAVRTYVASTASSLETPDDSLGPQIPGDRAALAAAMVCTPITFSRSPVGGIEVPSWFVLPDGSDLGWPGWSGHGPLRNLRQSWATTYVQIVNKDDFSFLDDQDSRSPATADEYKKPNPKDQTFDSANTRWVVENAVLHFPFNGDGTNGDPVKMHVKVYHNMQLLFPIIDGLFETSEEAKEKIFENWTD